MSGDVHVRFCERLGVRFPRATHLVMGFANEHDARRVLNVLPKRLARYGLAMHPSKTRLVAFRPHGTQKPGSFDFLGFTHYWGRSRQGRPAVMRKTARDRFSRALKRIIQWCRRARHLPIAVQHTTLVEKLRGHYAYYGITGNSRALSRFHQEVRRVWKKWLGRRSWHTPKNWAWFVQFIERHPLPVPRIVHSAITPT